MARLPTPSTLSRTNEAAITPETLPVREPLSPEAKALMRQIEILALQVEMVELKARAAEATLRVRSANFEEAKVKREILAFNASVSA